MTDLDRKIEEALALEDQILKNKFDEQGIFTQWMGAYRGIQGWLAIMVTVVIVTLTVGMFYSGYSFLTSADPDESLRWGAAVWILMTMISFLKMWFWMRMESNRVIREVKRVELQLVRLQGKVAD